MNYKAVGMLCKYSLSLFEDQLCSSNNFIYYTNTTEPFGQALLLHVACSV